MNENHPVGRNPQQNFSTNHLELVLNGRGGSRRPRKSAYYVANFIHI